MLGFVGATKFRHDTNGAHIEALNHLHLALGSTDLDEQIFKQSQSQGAASSSSEK